MPRVLQFQTGLYFLSLVCRWSVLWFYAFYVLLLILHKVKQTSALTYSNVSTCVWQHYQRTSKLCKVTFPSCKYAGLLYLLRHLLVHLGLGDPALKSGLRHTRWIHPRTQFLKINWQAMFAYVYCRPFRERYSEQVLWISFIDTLVYTTNTKEKKIIGLYIPFHSMQNNISNLNRLFSHSSVFSSFIEAKNNLLKLTHSEW
jgi:hypothetical protein